MKLESVGYLALSAFLAYVVLAGSLYLFLPRVEYLAEGYSLSDKGDFIRLEPHASIYRTYPSFIQERSLSVLYTFGGHYANFGEYLGAIATVFILNLGVPIFFLGGAYFFLFGSLDLFLESIAREKEGSMNHV